MAQYEYKCLLYSNKNQNELAGFLNVEGNNGWEVIAAFKENKDYTVVFKRRVG
jgi:hypothetical protein